ncbi:large ribosomal subunit protein uL2m [Lepeophtheirus salmonis]|uniref:large ribosomal subunit protein uL2m n=1 Tax=Lepeophtheirus salmonis TaxID=72036 RepID=UPI001AE60DD9|nr:39S ribosomal protein L2, mitochondrial-like [Lepeophtheirus salmonis]
MSLGSSLLFRSLLPRSVQFTSLRYTDRKHRIDFKILKDDPNLGPHKKLAPGVKYGGRVGENVEYRRIIHYPEKYTIKKLDITKLGGRDPETGRKVVEGIGGGSKQKARWIHPHRFPKEEESLSDEDVFLEKVISVCYNPLSDAQIALTAYGKKMRWILAVEGLSVGTILKSTHIIPKIPIQTSPGNSHPIGALPFGTEICCMEFVSGEGMTFIRDAGNSATILRDYDDKRVVIRNNNKKIEYAVDKWCQCVVGKVSTHPLKKLPIGSPNRMRWMGNRPRSGLWQRKKGIHGRKIRAPPPVKVIRVGKDDEEQKTIRLHAGTEGIRGMPAGRKRHFDINKW